MKTNEISNYSHGDMLGGVAKAKEFSDYEYVFYTDEKYSVHDYNE